MQTLYQRVEIWKKWHEMVDCPQGGLNPLQISKKVCRKYQKKVSSEKKTGKDTTSKEGGLNVMRHLAVGRYDICRRCPQWKNE